jgi:hypothetical protein
MPRITVSTDGPDGPVTHTEWVSRDDFETRHFRLQLAERLAWAVADATESPTLEAAPRHERDERWISVPAGV